jgi:hypothetical protein
MPHIVIPMHYKIPGRTAANTPLAPVDDFLNAAANAPWDAVQHDTDSSLTLTKDTLPKGTEVVVLTAGRVG